MSDRDARIDGIIADGQRLGLICLGGEIPGLREMVAGALPVADDAARVEATHADAVAGVREAEEALEKLRRRALDGHAIDAKQLAMVNSDLATARELAEMTEQAVSAARGRLDVAARPINVAVVDEAFSRLRKAQVRHAAAKLQVNAAHAELNDAFRAESSMQGALTRQQTNAIDAVRLFATSR